MRMRFGAWTGTLLAVGALLAGCQERLLTPADCPALCPGGRIVVRDTVLLPIQGGDSTFTGYVEAGLADAMLVSNGLPAADARGYVRFIKRGDSLFVNDTVRAYTIDSVKLRVAILGRDSLQPGLALGLYRLPATMDSSVSFADLDAALTPSALIASIPVPDTLHADTLSVMLTGDSLAAVALAPADSGVLRMGIGLSAPAPTGVRVAALVTGITGPLFITYVTVDIADTTQQKSSISRGAIVTTYRTAAPPPAPTATTHVLGGAPSSRVLLRFELPPRLRDSAEFVRATLELIPTGPIAGLANVRSQVQARGVLADLGAKSPVATDPALTGFVNIEPFTTDTISVDVVRIVRLWRADVVKPQAIFLSLSPEASSFMVPVFGSTGDPLLQPRLRIEYVLPFEFVSP